MAARSLGTTRSQTLFRVHIFLLRPPVLAALLLVFVDVMKELPATLVLRPFDFDTLATLVYMRASLGKLKKPPARSDDYSGRAGAGGHYLDAAGHATSLMDG